MLKGALGAAGLGFVGGNSTARAAVSTAAPSDRTIVEPEDFDFDNGNIIRDFFFGWSTILYEPVAAMDVPIIFRVTHLSQTAWFDATAPYHATAVGIYTRLDRRPTSEHTNRNKNIAVLYGAFRVLEGLLPQVVEDRREVMLRFGLDPDDRQESTDNPIGIGNLAGWGVVEARMHDGMNQLGDEGGRRFNRRPYADYIGYQPRNTAFELTEPAHWQPELGPHLRRLDPSFPSDFGAFTVQAFSLPHWSVTKPYSFDDPAEFRIPPPPTSDPRGAGYREQVEEVVAASAALTDEQKMMAEFFDNKFTGIGRAVAAMCEHHQLDLDGWIELCLVCSTATFDAGIAAWSEKVRHDAVRPFSAVRYVYGDGEITAWGGAGQGTVSLPATQWTSFIRVGDHAEYPSGSTTLAAAQAHAASLYLDSDEIGYAVTLPQGSSLVEPGLTPATDLNLRWDTFDEYNHDCGMSRVWGGVHFPATVEASWELGPRVAERAYAFVRRHIDGDVD
ncbi:vanadium-dependent haloperoxidase [Streptomyces sp. B6B3]|uniref:vanadium-dependent haloperoxidase n=1 Tax=Streptomyces sp. B6B3 TaxID=3153570 RepID=UPI00325DBC19